METRIRRTEEAGYALAMSILVALAAWRAAGGPLAPFVVVGLAACALHWHVWQRTQLRVRGVVGLAVLLRLVAFPLGPSLSDDTYRYVWDGLVQRIGLNPYLHLPTDPALSMLREGGLFDLLNSPAYYSVYPPLSQLVFLLGAWVGDGDWRLSYYVIKGILVAIEIGAVLLLARLVDARRLALYAWHPLVLLEVAGQAHTEAALVLALVGLVWAVRAGRASAAGTALAAAVWVKLYPLLLLPLVARRMGWRAIVVAALVSLALVAPYADAAAPGHVASSLRLYVNLFEFNAGPYYLINHLLQPLLGYNPNRMLGPALVAVLLAFVAYGYRRSAEGRWPAARTMVWILGAYLCCATTVHPWYFLGVLALLPLCPRVGAHWWWLAAFSFPTYFHYEAGVVGAAGYWMAVIGGWGGGAVIAGYAYRHRWLAVVLRRRGAAKARRIRRFLPPQRPVRVLDLGAGEGWVGAHLARVPGVEVVLADVVDPASVGPPASALPYVRYDGRTLPFAADSFDVVVLYFVLHHAEAPARVLHEALRVARSRVIVVESVYVSAGELRRLTLLDKTVNRLRLDGAMGAQEPHLQFRTVDAWRRFFATAGATVVAESGRGRWVHRQHTFVLAPPTAVVT